MLAAKSKNSHSAVALAAAAFAKYEAALHRYVLKRLRRPMDAHDLTQEIFERFMKVDRAEAIRNPQAYLFGIASHVVAEARYEQEHNLVTYDSELAEKTVEAAGNAAPNELADTLGLQRDILEALHALPENHLAALLLVKSEGLSYEEAARVAGFTESTVGTYVTHARAKLKLILEEYWTYKDRPK
jgi:RNA polymerase sigma-70 factor, ECF subfamily